MTTFLRVGQRIINLELVTDVELLEDQVAVWLASPGLNTGARLLIFKGEEVKALTEWFGQHGRDIFVENNPAGFAMPHTKK